MAKTGIGERAAWKDRIDQSPWIDGSRWLPEEGAPAEDVEFLEVEPSAYRLGGPGQREAPAGGRPTAQPAPTCEGGGASPTSPPDVPHKFSHMSATTNRTHPPEAHA